jgi:serine phosphatase RsbU (regulator of sigma subunit)
MWNKLLERQIKRHIRTADINSAEFQDLFAAVSQAYNHHEEDRQLIERSLDLSSRELTDANRALREAKNLIEIRNKEMISSLEYARLVQTSLLARESSIHETFGDSFVFNQPRDIVGGDFFWVREEMGRTFLCVADCTGHGVPGAFMSVISFRLLNQAVRDYQIRETDQILTFMNEEIKKTMSGQMAELENKDALDISLVAFDAGEQKMEFAGLGQRILLCNQGEILEIRGDRAHIGQNLSTAEKPISRQYFPYEKGDVLYLFTDGVLDQFGGTELKKFGIHRLRLILRENWKKSLPEQKNELISGFSGWMEDRPQIDDVLLVGIRL